VLERLIGDGAGLVRIIAVVTRPDQPRGRGLKYEPSEVAAVADHFQLPLLKPTRIRTAEFPAQLRAFAPDLLIVVAYGRILPAEVLQAARLMPINLHASLLPRHRGASPIEAAILAGDATTGVTVMRMTERMDAGPILLQRELDLAPDETQRTLKDRLADLGARAMLEALDLLRCGRLTERPQDESRATYVKPIKKEDARIDWRADAASIERMVRAYDPWPVARTSIDGTDLMLWKAQLSDATNPPAPACPPGTITALRPMLTVQCGIGTLALLEVQLGGRRRISGADFARGRRLAPGSRLGT
jgi:methionyl-tRNA formyltransferase